MHQASRRSDHVSETSPLVSRREADLGLAMSRTGSDGSCLLRCPEGSRTLGQGSSFSTDCGCEEGRIDVATTGGPEETVQVQDVDIFGETLANV